MFERYYRELLGFLSRAVKDRDTAADLAQESYLRVLAAQQAGRPVKNPRALLYGTARNLVIDQHRRAAVRAEAIEPWPDDGEAGLEGLAGPRAREPDAVIAGREDLAAVIATIDRLPPRCREAFILHVFDGLSHAQIAERMGASVSMVEKHIARGRLACRACQRRFQGLASGTDTGTSRGS